MQRFRTKLLWVIDTRLLYKGGSGRDGTQREIEVRAQ